MLYSQYNISHIFFTLSQITDKRNLILLVINNYCSPSIASLSLLSFLHEKNRFKCTIW